MLLTIQPATASVQTNYCTRSNKHGCQKPNQNNPSFKGEKVNLCSTFCKLAAIIFVAALITKSSQGGDNRNKKFEKQYNTCQKVQSMTKSADIAACQNACGKVYGRGIFDDGAYQFSKTTKNQSNLINKACRTIKFKK